MIVIHGTHRNRGDPGRTFQRFFERTELKREPSQAGGKQTTCTSAALDRMAALFKCHFIKDKCIFFTYLLLRSLLFLLLVVAVIFEIFILFLPVFHRNHLVNSNLLQSLSKT